MTNPPAIDLLGAASFAHGQPHEQFRWLRRNAPVYWHPQAHGRGFWAVTRYHDVRAVGRDPKTYSSYKGGILIDDPAAPALAASRNMMLMMDPPQHTRYRQLVSRQFTPHSVQPLRPRIEELAARIIDRVSARGECDLVRDIAGELPSYVIADLMGIPLEDGRRLYQLTEKMHGRRRRCPKMKGASHQWRCSTTRWASRRTSTSIPVPIWRRSFLIRRLTAIG